jgi:outer membrane lipoprotein-sorting protein
MKVCRTALVALVALAGAGASNVVAQDAKKAPPSNPVGIGSNWSNSVTKEGPAGGIELDKKQMDLVQKVNAYFKDLPDLKGNFVQTNADGKTQRGKLYFKRPGRFRFDYARPSRMVVISDGTQLAIQDTDVNSDDRIELDQTPFRVLLRQDVDLVRDARILEVQEVDGVIVIALQDKSPDTIGRIKLHIAQKPAMELKQWITTDAQGLDTRLDISDLTKGEELDAALFKPQSIGLKRLQQ